MPKLFDLGGDIYLITKEYLSHKIGLDRDGYGWHSIQLTTSEPQLPKKIGLAQIEIYLLRHITHMRE
jgi:hypothetical protein